MLVRRAGGQIDNFGDGLEFLAGTGAQDVEFDRKRVEGGVFLNRLGLADYPQAGAGRVQVQRAGWEEPVFELFGQFLLFFFVLDFTKPRHIGMRLEFSWHRALCAQEKDGRFLKSFFSARSHQTRPPVWRHKILPSEREFFEVILQQEPGALRIGAIGKNIQYLGSFSDRRLGVR